MQKAAGNFKAKRIAAKNPARTGGIPEN